MSEFALIPSGDVYALSKPDDLILLKPKEFLQVETARGKLPAIRLEDEALAARVLEGSITCEHYGICHEFPAGTPWPLSAVMRLNVGTIMVVLDHEEMGRTGETKIDLPSAPPEWIEWAMRDGFALSFGRVGEPGPYLATGPMHQFPGGIVMVPGEIADLVAEAAKKPGRNDPCPCGSGRKWKKCHG